LRIRCSCKHEVRKVDNAASTTWTIGRQADSKLRDEKGSTFGARVADPIRPGNVVCRFAYGCDSGGILSAVGNFRRRRSRFFGMLG
jgi:hypothetical protein